MSAIARGEEHRRGRIAHAAVEAEAVEAAGAGDDEQPDADRDRWVGEEREVGQQAGGRCRHDEPALRGRPEQAHARKVAADDPDGQGDEPPADQTRRAVVGGDVGGGEGLGGDREHRHEPAEEDQPPQLRQGEDRAGAMQRVAQQARLARRADERVVGRAEAHRRGGEREGGGVQEQRAARPERDEQHATPGVAPDLGELPGDPHERAGRDVGLLAHGAAHEGSVRARGERAERADREDEREEQRHGRPRPRHRGGKRRRHERTSGYQPAGRKSVDDAREQPPTEQKGQKAEREGERGQQRRTRTAVDDDGEHHRRDARAEDRDELGAEERAELARGDRRPVADLLPAHGFHRTILTGLRQGRAGSEGGACRSASKFFAADPVGELLSSTQSSPAHELRQLRRVLSIEHDLFETHLPASLPNLDFRPGIVSLRAVTAAACSTAGPGTPRTPRRPSARRRAPRVGLPRLRECQLAARARLVRHGPRGALSAPRPPVRPEHGLTRGRPRGKVPSAERLSRRRDAPPAVARQRRTPHPLCDAARRRCTAALLTALAAALLTCATPAAAPGRRAPDPGALPQTEALPSSLTPAFRARVAALWRGIRADSLAAALPSFFPRSAYLQVKQIADAGADYDERLVGNFRRDIAAAHALLGASARHARLVGVSVPRQWAWIPPGYCYNRVGYWHAPGARLIYAVGRSVRSFGVFSFISWRGQWYVVHLAVWNTPGTVDDPASGVGSYGPPGGC